MRNYLTTLIAITLLIITTQTLRGTKSQKAERILQTNNNNTDSFGEYKIEKSPEIGKYCTDKGISEDDIVLPEDEQKKKQEKLEKYYKGVREPMEQLVKTRSMPGGAVGKFFMWPVVLTLWMTSWSLWCCPFMFFWCLCSGLCCKSKDGKKAGCCLKRRQPGEKESFWVKCTTFTTIGFGGGLFLTLFFFFINAGKTVGSLKYMSCGLSMIHNDMTNGAKLKDGVFFIGTNGVSFLKGKINSALDEIVGKNQATLQEIVDLGMDVKATTLRTKMNDIKAIYGAAALTFTPVDGSGTAQATASTTLLKDSMPGFELEVDTLKTAATDIHNAMKQAADIAGGAGSSMKQNIDSGFKALEDVFKQLTDQLTNLRDTLLTVLDEEKIKTPANFFIWGFCGIIGGFSIFLLVIIVLATFFDKCKCLALSGGKFFMVIEMFFSIWINLIGVVVVLLAAVLVNLCYFINLALNDKAFVGDLSKELSDVLKPCLYEDSSGNLKELIEADSMDGINDLTDLTSGNYFIFILFDFF